MTAMHMGEDGGLSDGRPSVVASAPTSDQTLGASSLGVSRLGFGAWGLAARDWDARVDVNDAIRAIERALDLGITLFDTAPSYGGGESETLLGRVVGGRSGAARRDRMVLATKCGPYDDPRPSLEASLRRLRSDRVELFQLHEIPTESGAMERQLERMHALVERGLAHAIGVCNATSLELSRALTVAPVASYQGPYNLLDRDAEDDAFACAHSHGIAALAYRPLASGMLTGKYSTPPHFAATDHRSHIHWFRGREFARRHAVVDALRPIARAQELTVTQLALAWALSRPGVTAVLAGARTEAQVDENAKAARVSLSANVMTAIDAAVGQAYAPRALRRNVEVADSVDAAGDVMVRMCDRGIVRTLVVGEREAYVMRRLDGRTPYACIAAEWESPDGARLLTAQVVLLVDQLADLGLLEDSHDA